MSEVSHWMNPLPDIALDTLLVSRLEAGWACPTSSPGPELISKSRQCHKRVALNVGGVRHEVTWRLLDQFPQGSLQRRKDKKSMEISISVKTSVTFHSS